MLKVLFVAMRWDYKDPARGDSFEYTNFWDTLTHMNEIEPRLFAFDEVEASLGRESMNHALLAEVREWKPDVVFFLMFEDEFQPEVVRKISDIVPTVNWFADDQWRFRSFSRHWAEHLTWVATMYGPAVDSYRRVGQNNVILTQFACNHFLYKPMDVVRDLDVTFVGQPHGSRRKVIQHVRSSGIEVEAWGHGWDNGRLTQPQMIQVFSRSKVNLNLSNASLPTEPRAFLRPFLKKKGMFIVPRFGHLLDGLADLRSKLRDQIKGRNFEVPGCKAFLLTSRVAGLERYYEFEREIATFKGEEELLKKLSHFLNEDEAREQIAKAGYERTLQDHTYERRFKEMFTTMGLL